MQTETCLHVYGGRKEGRKGSSYKGGKELPVPMAIYRSHRADAYQVLFLVLDWQSPKGKYLNSSAGKTKEPLKKKKYKRMSPVICKIHY